LEVEAEGHPLDHQAGDKYQHVSVGDTIWLVSVRAGKVELYGRIVVGEVADQAGASRALDTQELKQAEYHILAAVGTVQPSAIRDIHDLAPQLRFADPDLPDRLVIEPMRAGGVVTAYQLLPLRRLTPASVELLSKALGRGSPKTLE
jgi:hypothetical protein